MGDDEPRFGYERDRDAERIRDALRAARLMEFSASRAGYRVAPDPDNDQVLLVSDGS